MVFVNLFRTVQIESGNGLFRRDSLPAAAGAIQTGSCVRLGGVTLILAAGFDWVTEAESWVAFATLLAMEIVLGIDNVVFISILAD